MNNLEQIFGTYIEPDESWQSVFDRVSATGALDMKTLTKVIIYLLERFDEYERHRKQDESGRAESNFGATPGGTDVGIQEGVGGTNEETPTDPESTTADSDSGIQEPMTV